MLILMNYACGEWVRGTGRTSELFHAVTGDRLGEAGSGGLDFQAMTQYARTVGGPAMRALTFHQRAAMLKALGKYLMERKDAFYLLSSATGATKGDSWVDIDGGIGTFFAYSSRGRREFPNETFHVEGPTEPLSKNGTFVGRHICVPLEGVAVHINAFNFPVWGMMEKLAPALLAGMPCIVKPATATSYLTEAVFRAMIESRILPEGAIQLICGSAGDLLSHVSEQDAVAFTGSAATGQLLKESRAIMQHSVRFNMEADSLNCCILGPDAVPGTEEFELFIKEVVREMTTKAGQKCTAVRRTIVPSGMEDDVVKALRPHTTKVLDVHLMIAPADPYIEAFARAGADIITVHAEAGPHLDRSLGLIRSLGRKAGVSLTPHTPESMIEYVLDKVDLVLAMTVNPGFGGQAFIPAQIEKIRRIAAMIGKRPVHLQVDGGVTVETAKVCAAAGAGVLVAGSAVFRGGAYAANIAAIRAAAESGRA